MLPLKPKEIPAAFQQARAAQAKGDAQTAVALYHRILAAKPGLAEVHFNLAQIAASAGNPTEAIAALKIAAKLKPTEPAIWSAWIDVAKSARDKKALAELSKRLPKSGLPKTALAQLQARVGGGTVDAEETALKAAIKKNKGSAGAYGQYGAYLANHGRLAEAIVHLKKAVKLAPSSAQARLILGQASLQAGDLETARVSLAKAASLGLASAQVSIDRGRVALAQKDDVAVDHFAEALRLGGATAERHMLHAAALRAARRDEEALAAYDAALEFDPGAPAILAEKAALLQNTGNAGQARELIAEALTSEPSNGSLYLLYASAGKLESDDPVMQRAIDLHAQGAKDRYLSFAISKAVREPFPYLVEANALSREAYPYSFEADVKQIKVVRDAWKKRNPKGWNREADTEPAPIFVTGMPRSGTTLVEQIIAAHSDVASAGEVGVLGRYFKDVPHVPDMDLVRRRYWQMLQGRFPGVGRITDKSIATYVNIGFIKTVLPSAKIVVVRRDPRDNALSIFKNMFADGQHRYSNDLRDIARFMRLFEEQVAFWEAELPGSFTEVRYDDVIAEPEVQSRKLIADVGLDWQDACLSFYDNTARVDTLSNVQVRQPIYASSVGAWEKYQIELAPFLETYGPIRSWSSSGGMGL